MIELEDKQKTLDYFMGKIKIWQKYIEYNFLENIKLSNNQLRILEYNDNQMMINGIAGTGKSVILIYKFIKTMIEENKKRKILYVSYNKTLIDDMRKKANTCKEYNEMMESKKHEIKIKTFHEMAYEILTEDLGYENVKKVATNINNMENIIQDAVRRVGRVWHLYTEKDKTEYKRLPAKERLYASHTMTFVRDEILWIKANGLLKLEDYLEIDRVGRGNIPRLTKEQRKTIFKIFQKYEEDLRSDRYNNHINCPTYDLEDYALRILENYDRLKRESLYDYIFIDEVQDFQAMQLLVLKKLAKRAIIIAGDNKQKIYKKSPLRYKDLGLNIQGKRIKNLIENYRSTKEIMALASSIKIKDDEKDTKTKYVNEGEKPEIIYFNNENKMAEYMVKSIKEIHEKRPKDTIAIIHRREEFYKRNMKSGMETYLKKYFRLIGINDYNKRFDYGKERQVFYTDVFTVKGLEFDHVFVMDFDNQHYPLASEFKSIRDNKNEIDKSSQDFTKDKEEIIEAERKRLYVALTRAKKTLKLIYSAPTPEFISPFVKDFNLQDYKKVRFDEKSLKRIMNI